MVGTAQARLCPPYNFLCQLICPDGQSAHACHAQIARRVILSQPDGIAVTPKSAADSTPSRLTKRGASRSSRTLRRDAVDAAVSLTSDTKADGKIVWSRHPDAGVKFSREAIPVKATVAIKPGTPG